jgi:hypothetical protein
MIIRAAALSRYLPVAAAVLSVVLALPSLGAGWMVDDYFHRAILLDTSWLRDLIGPPAAMFRFFRGDPERTGRLIDIGLFPWWTDPNLKGEMFQALTVLTHRLDYALWPDSPVLMHAHNLFWLGAAVGLTALYYQRIVGSTWTAAVAAFLFAVDDARGATAGWVANRNALVAATFGVLALVVHDRARRGGSRPAFLLAPLLLMAALLSKEEGIGTIAYLGAYALFVDPRGRGRGCVALWPYAVTVVVWAGIRAYLGYGVRDVGLYVDPLTDTWEFSKALENRLPILLFGQWSPIPAEVATPLKPPLSTALWWLAAAYLAVLALAMAPLFRRDRLARFWATGMVLAAIPVSATIPMDRLLTFVGIGAAGLLAQFWGSVFGAQANGSRVYRWRGPAKGVAWYLVIVHAVIAPIVLPLRAANPTGPRWVEERLYVGSALESSVGDRTVVIVNAPSPANASYTILRRELDGRSVPRRMRVLAPAFPSVTIRRLDERTLAVRPEGGYLRWFLDQVFRTDRRPFALGDTVNLTGMVATISALTADGRPAEATFRFDVPLESPSLIWLCFRVDRFEPFTPPAVGEEVEIRFDWKDLLWPHPAVSAAPPRGGSLGSDRAETSRGMIVETRSRLC